MITFIATAYRETIDTYQFISCLLLQTNPNWKCIIYCDEPNEYIKKSIEFYNDDRISYYENESPKGWWGHYNRKEALYNLVDTEFVIQTSIQDYYTPNTVDILSRHANFYDFIYFDCVHNHFNYDVLISEPKSGRIDWGSFTIRTEIAKSVGINHVESSIGDGQFVEDCFRHPNIRYIKLNKILTVHN